MKPQRPYPHSITLRELSTYGDSLDLSLLTDEAVKLIVLFRKLQQEAFAKAAQARTQTVIQEVARFTYQFHELMSQADEIGERRVVLALDGPAKIVTDNPNSLQMRVINAD